MAEKGWTREREREGGSLTSSLPQKPQRLELVQAKTSNLEAMWVSIWVAGPQMLGSSSTAFPELWTGSGTAGTEIQSGRWNRGVARGY